MCITTVVCPRCKSRIRKDGFRKGKQRYKCVECGRETVNPVQSVFFKEVDEIVTTKGTPNILIIGDTHIPFEHPEYLGFCKRMYNKYKCEIVVHVGDLVDNHGINFHEHNPNGMSSGAEIKLAKERLGPWFDAFPNVKVCKGNHDELPSRRAIREGLAEDYFKSFEDMWELPKGWSFAESYQIGGIKFFHGTGFSGLYPHANASRANMQSIVMGHCHSVAGDYVFANDVMCIFGLAVGCGIDVKKYAFAYNKTFKYKPILGCGLITDNGEDARFIRMRL